MGRATRWPGLRQWMGGALLLVLIPGVIASIVLQYRSIERHQANELSADLELARAVGSTFDTYVQDLLHQELAIGLAVPLALGESAERADVYLAANAAGSPAIRAFAWIDPSGRVAAASDPADLGVSVAADDYFRAVRDGEDHAVSNLVAQGGPTFVVARAIRQDGVLVGVVAAAVDPTRLGEVLGLVRGGVGTVGIVDRSGRVVYRSPGPELTWEERLSDTAIVGSALGDRGIERGGFAAVPWERGAMTVGVTPIAGLGWAAVAGRPAGAVMGPIVRDALWNLGVLLVFWALALFGALVVARRVTRPIRALRAHAAALGRGELDLPAPVDGPSEVRDLAEAINAMAAALAAREREREDYTHAISHDLRTPLTAILINAQLLRAAQERADVDAVQRRRAESIELCAQDMHGLIRDLLDSVRLDEGQLRLDLAPVDVGRLAWNVVARLSDADAARVDVTVDPSLPPVAADAQRLERVLANLIGNALRYSPAAAPVRVAAEASDGQLRVSVRDEGPGIDPDELPRLFQRHGRTSSGLARSDSLGLGLYIVRGIVAAHDGRVWVDSVVGRGSTFGFTIPLTSPLATGASLAVGDPSTAA